jgi:hypothetical protein
MKMNCWRVIIIMAAGILGIFQTIAAEKAGPAVLFTSSGEWGKASNMHTYQEWLDEGFEIDIKPLEQIKNISELKKFSVVVINSLPYVNNEHKVSEGQLDFEQVIAAYLKSGGSVILIHAGGEWDRGVPSFEHFLSSYGAGTAEEQITDSRNILGLATPRGLKFNYTTDIAKDSPLTKGISRLGYFGQAVRADAMKTTNPLIFTDKSSWKILARGEKTAYSASAAEPGRSEKLKSTPATYSENPPFIAIRSVGRGQLLVMAQSSAALTASPEVVENILWHKNDMTEPGLAQNRTFIINAVKQMAESGKANGFGGYIADRTIIPDKEYVLNGTNADWSKIPSLLNTLPQLNYLRGIVGAQSTFSGGRHSVAELSRAAGAAGLDFLVFTEKLEKMNAEKWGTLKKECKAASSDKFLAFPGLIGLDKVGNRWFVFGYADYPTVPGLTTDRKRIDNTYFLNAKIFGLRMTGYAYTGKNPVPPCEMRQCSGMSVFTYENGKQVDDAVTHFLRSSWNQEYMLPFAVAICDSPAAINETAQNTMLNIYTGISLKDFDGYVAGKGFASLHIERPQRWYLTRGPRLVQYGAVSGGFGVDEEKENRSAVAFRLTGLKNGDTVRLMNGEDVLREWQADKSELSTEFRWANDKLRSPVIEVKRNGEMVLVSSATMLQNGSFFNQCGDRQNTIPYVYLPDKKDNVYVSGTPIEMKYRGWTPVTNVYAPVKAWAIGAVGLELVPVSWSSWSSGPDIPIKSARQERRANLASYHYQVLSAPGIMIVDDIVGRVHPNGKTHLGDCFPPQLTEPLRFFNALCRKYALFGRIGEGQVNGQLLEGRINILEDIELSNGYIDVAFPKMSGATHVEYRNDGKVVRYAVSDPNCRGEFKMNTGDYIGLYPFGLAGGGAIFAVKGDLYGKLPSGQIRLKVPQQLKKGDVLEYSLLFTNGGSMPLSPVSDYERLWKHFGFGGSFPAIESVNGGTLEKSVVMPLVAVTPVSTLNVITKKVDDSPCGLIFRIRGFNPNWLVAWQLDGSGNWRFMGNDGKDFYFQLYTDIAAHKLFAGHPVTADDPEVKITLNDPEGGNQRFEIYNPTDKAKKVILSANESFLKKLTKTVELAPHESKNIIFSGKN